MVFDKKKKFGSKKEFGGRDFGGARSFERKPRSFDNDGQDRPMFAATCSECGDACEVPFKPRHGKPVMCIRCFKKAGGLEGAKFEGPRREFDRPRREFGNDRAPQGGSSSASYDKQFSIINSKLDAIIKTLSELTTEEVFEDEDEDGDIEE